MIEWLKKYLGWVGFTVMVSITLLSALDEFVFKNKSFINDGLLMLGFVIMGGAETIQGILNRKYFIKSSEKFKNVIIVFIISSTIGLTYLVLS